MFFSQANGVMPTVGSTASSLSDDPVDGLVAWLAAQLGIPPAAFTEYARRSQTMTDHSRALAAAFGMRLPTAADLPLMIEAAAQAAWSTDRGQPIEQGIRGTFAGAGAAGNGGALDHCGCGEKNLLSTKGSDRAGNDAMS
jgi:hypothetical protein